MATSVTKKNSKCQFYLSFSYKDDKDLKKAADKANEEKEKYKKDLLKKGYDNIWADLRYGIDDKEGIERCRNHNKAEYEKALKELGDKDDALTHNKLKQRIIYRSMISVPRSIPVAPEFLRRKSERRLRGGISEDL